jgi:hypothetical protein
MGGMRSVTVADIAAFGPTLVVVPQADHELLACGGTIAMLRDAEVPVSVRVVQQPPEVGLLRAARELWSALEELQVATVLHALAGRTARRRPAGTVQRAVRGVLRVCAGGAGDARRGYVRLRRSAARRLRRNSTIRTSTMPAENAAQ